MANLLRLSSLPLPPGYMAEDLHVPTARRPIRFPDPEDAPPPRPFHSHPVRQSSPLASVQNGSVGSRRRVHSRPVSTSLGPSQTSSHREVMSSVMEDSVFSDEYDLYPRILLDVQRALKLKARREARLKSVNSSPSSTKSEPVASSPSPAKTSPSRPTFSPIAFPPPVPAPIVHESEPSTSSGHSGPRAGGHPVPSSSDEGTTLDWSGMGAEDDKPERRWTMSITKRKDKDMKEKQPSYSAVETRESMYEAKITQIRTRVSPAALERASTACDQLGRRYKLIYNSLPSHDFNILKVARWFGTQEEVVKSSLEQAEPFIWLKDAQKAPQTSRNLSALIMEEYLMHLRGKSNHQRIASLTSSPSLSVVSRPPFPSPQGSSYFTIGPSLTRKLSYEGRISSEPLGEGRRSIDSRRSAESAYSSIFSGSSLPVVVVSPTAATALHRQVPSEPGSSRNSLSDHSDDGGRRSRPIPSLKPLNRDLFSGSALKTNGRGVIPDRPSLSPIPDDRPGLLSSAERLSIDLPPTATGRNFGQAKNLRQQLEKRRQQDADEEQASREYELKQQLLDATIAQNNRVRQLLHHIAAGSSLTTGSTTPYKGIPRELVDAFSHDPAAVTGATRTYKGWRAVDDIHHRLARQRETFREFLSRASNSALADPIAALMESLKMWDCERRDIAWRATEVSHALTSVQTIHAQVKAAYNGTLSHTSVKYPEISTIIELEESYQDNYQYVWEVAMDVLTFLLDIVAPFWRTYGKRVGTDPKRYHITAFPQRSLRHWIGLFLFFLGTVALTIFQTQAAMSSIWNFWLTGIPYTYVRRLFLIPFWISIIIQWWAVGAELSIVLTQVAVVVWWAGWYVNIFT
ncbi:hypothetical protein B0H14DRAFT_3028917 [Mycena olivaceomarginata]|nr:hypothetical protein B0H14DRAFT_3028917 [Mycena olivaceomarginata]